MPMHFDNSANSAKTKVMNSHKSAPRMNSESLPFEDPIVNEVRTARHELAATFDDDLEKISRDLMQRQTRLGQQLRVTEHSER